MQWFRELLARFACRMCRWLGEPDAPSGLCDSELLGFGTLQEALNEGATPVGATGSGPAPAPQTDSRLHIYIWVPATSFCLSAIEAHYGVDLDAYPQYYQEVWEVWTADASNDRTQVGHPIWRGVQSGGRLVTVFDPFPVLAGEEYWIVADGVANTMAGLPVTADPGADVVDYVFRTYSFDSPPGLQLSRPQVNGSSSPILSFLGS